MFILGKGADLTQTSVQMSVSLRKELYPEIEFETSIVRARYASAMVKTKIPPDIEKRMIRVTKKNPPKELMVQIFLDAANNNDDVNDSSSSSSKYTSKVKIPKLTTNKQSKAALITDSFSPTSGSGRVFIGFRTSQTTGLGIHLAAPLMPTVEREAIDFVDPALREFNSELLEVCGILMRLALEHEMGRVGILWEEHKGEREQWLAKKQDEKKKRKDGKNGKLKIGENASGNDSLSDKNDNPTDNNNTTPSISGSLFSFATFMARGVKNTLVEAIKSVPEILGEDDETTELLNPEDDRPLSMEERDAIVLMKAYCPRPSTPDSLVGQFLAKGFSRCLPSYSPPVLTTGGVVRGNDARLCHHGMESFCISNVVRRVMLENAREYHTLIASCPTLTMNDLISSLKGQVLEEKMLVRLLKWWPKFCRIDRGVERYGPRLKEVIRFEMDMDEELQTKKNGSSSNTPIVSVDESDNVELLRVHNLESILYYTVKKISKELPLPETAFSPSLQDKIGLRTLEDPKFREWFTPLPFEIWTGFISQHSCLTKGRPEEDRMRIQALVALSKHYDSLEMTGGERNQFVALLPRNVPCIPIDSNDDSGDPSFSSKYKTAIPSELYLGSSDLSAFEGVGKFLKVSKRVTREGVSDEFLLAMGVQKTVSMDFLFAHLDTLRWSDNPKNLISYLVAAELTNQDFLKLRTTRYLPAENDQSKMYAPSELYLKNDELKIFPFVRFLQWPASEGMPSVHRNFLMKLGVRLEPPLSSIMKYLESESANDKDASDIASLGPALQYVTQRLGPKGPYEREFNQYRSMKFLPCIRQNLETGKVVKEIQSPTSE